MDLNPILLDNPHTIQEGIAAWGFVFLWPRIVECWFIPGPYLKDYKFQVVRAIKKDLETMPKIHNLKRIQCTINSTNSKHVRFAEHLGFCLEAILSDFGPEVTRYYMMRYYPK